MSSLSNPVEQIPTTSDQATTSSSAQQWPIVYHSNYNISFMGMEKLHPFDAGKWGRIHQFLIDRKLIAPNSAKKPEAANDETLLLVHSERYLNSLKWSANVARITEVPPVALVPNYFVQRKVLDPLRLQTGGSILAGELAVRYGWGLNLGGGFHHCSADKGGGFCAFADITILIKIVLKEFEHIKKVMIIDLDAHQGNGHGRDFIGVEEVYILDMYNRNIYPHDGFAKKGIRRKVELHNFTEDEEYLGLVAKHVSEALDEFSPDFIVYNAGTDILSGDPLGMLEISPKGVIERDRIVFEAARSKDIPIVMLTSGGYQRSNAEIIANSILSLRRHNLIGPIPSTTTSTL